jgi:hypothetical protein
MLHIRYTPLLLIDFCQRGPVSRNSALTYQLARGYPGTQGLISFIRFSIFIVALGGMSTVMVGTKPPDTQIPTLPYTH